LLDWTKVNQKEKDGKKGVVTHEPQAALSALQRAMQGYQQLGASA